jgi:hypothetical protein
MLGFPHLRGAFESAWSESFLDVWDRLLEPVRRPPSQRSNANPARSHGDDCDTLPE